MVDATFIGFCPKRIVKRPDWLDAPSVREVCSVSDCISSAPEKMLERFDWNEAGFYHTEEAALAVIPPQEVGDYELFAFRVLPYFFDDSGMHPFDVRSAFKDLAVEPSLDQYQMIGYDIVERCGESHFECSPLSCNGYAKETRVNSSCLVDSLQEAKTLGVIFGDSDRSRVEPGPYHVVEVWRRNR